jgi:hypothetical protein
MILLRIQTKNIAAMLYSSIRSFVFGVHALDDRQYTQLVLYINQASEFLLFLYQPRTYEIKCVFASNVFYLSFWLFFSLGTDC